MPELTEERRKTIEKAIQDCRDSGVPEWVLLPVYAWMNGDRV